MRVVIHRLLSKPLYHAKDNFSLERFPPTCCMFHPSSYSLIASFCQNQTKDSMFPNFNQKQIRRIPSTWHLLYRAYITWFINGHIYSIFLSVRTKILRTKVVMFFWTQQKIKFSHIMQHVLTSYSEMIFLHIAITLCESHRITNFLIRGYQGRTGVVASQFTQPQSYENYVVIWAFKRQTLVIKNDSTARVKRENVRCYGYSIPT